VPSRPSILVALLQGLCHGRCQQTHLTLFHAKSAAEGDQKYIKDEGHAVMYQTDADDIINTATTQEIYNLTLGLSDKERRILVAGKAH
jgi:hypothetical protein